jgi:hypothetical protein
MSRARKVENVGSNFWMNAALVRTVRNPGAAKPLPTTEIILLQQKSFLLCPTRPPHLLCLALCDDATRLPHTPFPLLDYWT